MTTFLLHRSLQAILVILAAFTLSFSLGRLAPGGPFSKERNASAEAIAARERAYGLDAPFHQQYVRSLKNFLRGDLGESYVYEGRRVSEMIRDALPISLTVAIAGLSIALLIGLPLGIAAAVRQNSLTDYLSTGAAMVGICLPSFVLGPILALLFGIHLNWFNASGWYDATDWFLPSLTLGLFYAAFIARLTRAGMLDVLAQDPIRTAHAKGLSRAAVFGKHALKQAILPVISFLGPAFAGLVSGSIVIERVFQIPGLGFHFVDAAINRDYTLQQGTAIFYASLIVAFNLLADLLQACLDPRIRQTSQKPKEASA